MGLTDLLGPAGSALGVVEGGVQFFEGLSKEKKDQAALNALHQPFYKIQDEVFQNRNIAASRAGQGLPSATRQYETQEAQRGLGSSLDAILRSGGGINDASLLLSKYNDTIGRIGSEDAAMHNANIQQFMKENAEVAAEKTKQWSINEYQPYEAKLKELKQNIATDEANKWGGINTALGSVSAGLTGMSNAALMKQLFGNKPATSTKPLGYVDYPGLATGIGGKVPSPAAGITNIDPNAFSKSAFAVATPQDTDYTDMSLLE